MRILFDQGAPGPLRRFLAGEEISTAWRMGWSQLSNGDLLTAAETAGFELLLPLTRTSATSKTSADARIAILVLIPANWPALDPHAQTIAALALTMRPGEYREWSPPA